jgi:clan AA aspartic protease
LTRPRRDPRVQIEAAQLGMTRSLRERQLRDTRIGSRVISVGLVYANLSLRNPRESDLRRLDVRALVDTGRMLLCIPEHVAIQLKLDVLEQRELTTADGSKKLCSYVGPIEVRFDGRGCFTGALVLGDEVLLGAVPMEDMDLVISPSGRSIVVNPESPNIPSAIVK